MNTEWTEEDEAVLLELLSRRRKPNTKAVSAELIMVVYQLRKSLGLTDNAKKDLRVGEKMVLMAEGIRDALKPYDHRIEVK